MTTGYPKTRAVHDPQGNLIGCVTTTAKGRHWAHLIYDQRTRGARFRTLKAARAYIDHAFYSGKIAQLQSEFGARQRYQSCPMSAAARQLAAGVA